MKIWIDADGCPQDVKFIVFKAAERTKVEAHVVANRALKIPPSPFIHSHVVGAGFDVADNYIVQHAEPEDIIITADIPLAAEIVELGAVALDPKGDVYDKGSIGERLSIRNFLTDLRSSGTMTGGSRQRNNTDNQRFAAAFDKHLQRGISDWKRKQNK